MTTKKAVLWFLFWVALAAIFNVGIYLFAGSEKAMEFLGGYVIEQSLSLDNLFLFLVIFSSFGIDTHCLRKVLSYGIAGVIVLRLIFILLGLFFVSRFHWILYFFGLILLYTGIKILIKKKSRKQIIRIQSF